MVQCLGLGALTARAWVWSPVGELRSHKPCSTAGKKKKSLRGCALHVYNGYLLVVRLRVIFLSVLFSEYLMFNKTLRMN